jgi:hypothetical protein
MDPNNPALGRPAETLLGWHPIEERELEAVVRH